MARLTAAKRRSLPASDFAGPNRSYPIDTPARATAAAGLAGMHHASAAIKANIRRKAVAKGFAKSEHRSGNIDHSSPRSHDMKRGRPVQGGNGMGHHPPHHRSHGLSHEQYMAGGAKPVNIMDSNGDYDGD